MIKNYIEAKVKTLDEKGSFEVVASTGKVDRLGDTIDPKGWYLTNYKKNPVILWSHSTGGFGSTAIPPVGKADKVWVEDGKKLKIKGHFADTPFAQELKTLVEGGFLNAVSVGFMPLIEDKKGLIKIEEKMYRRVTDEEIKKGLYDNEYGEKFTKQELLEVSWVSVPALPQALVSARKMKLSLVTKALEEEIKETPKESKTYEKPYPNEHSCRLENPDKYKRFRRKNCEVKHDEKCIDVIYGITKGEEEKVERQSLRYDKEIWTESSAKSHCKDKEGTFEPASEKKEKVKKTKESNTSNTSIEKCIISMEVVLKDLKLELLNNKNLSNMETAIEALKEDKNPEKSFTPNGKKGRKTFIKQKSKKSDSERLLIMFDKMCEILLKKLRQQRD